MTNWEIALNLMDVKTLLSLQGNRRLASMYEKSAFSVAALERNISSVEDILFLPERVRADVDELVRTGKLSFKKELEDLIPKGLRMIGSLPEMRPDNAIKIYEALGVGSISDLRRIITNGKMRSTNGFGIRIEEQVRKSLLAYEKGKKTLTLFEGFSYGNSIKSLLRENGIEKVEVAGSVRRGKEVASNVNVVIGIKGDVEFAKSVIKKNIRFKRVSKESGEKLYLTDRRNTELKFLIVKEPYFYSALAYYTGSKVHNNKIKHIAKVKGFKVSREGYIDFPFRSEEELYKSLSLQYIPPELREGGGEVEAASKNLLPELITYDDINGDLHTHTDFSDGTNSLYDMVEEAIFHGYEYLAITDHSESARVANGLNSHRLLKQIKIIDKMNKSGEITLLKGSELEIGKNGDIDYGDSLLNSLDIRIGGMHTGFEDDKMESTRRITNALSSGFIDILAHPTGRLVPIREGFKLDMEKVFDCAVKYNVALEVDVFPNRMDLSSNLIKQARNFGVQYFSVDTDSHNAGHLNFMKYGVKILRRAGLKKENVVNTFEKSELKKWLLTRKHLKH